MLVDARAEAGVCVVLCQRAVHAVVQERCLLRGIVAIERVSGAFVPVKQVKYASNVSCLLRGIVASERVSGADVCSRMLSLC